MHAGVFEPLVRRRFAKISRTHVEEACGLLVKGGAGGGGGSYFVGFEGNDLPAKRVLREAYQRANQTEIGAKEFSKYPISEHCPGDGV